MYVRESIPVTILTEYDVEDVEILWCKLRPSRLPRGFSHLIVATVYRPPTADDGLIINHITDTLSKIESAMPNAAIIIVGDFNRLNINQIANQFRLKQLVKFRTRGEVERTLDLILTNLAKFYQKPEKNPPFGLSDHFTVTISPLVRPSSTNSKKLTSVRKKNKSSVDAMEKFLNTIDWSVLTSLSSMTN
jgi:hypothetical protein